MYNLLTRTGKISIIPISLLIGHKINASPPLEKNKILFDKTNNLQIYESKDLIPKFDELNKVLTHNNNFFVIGGSHGLKLYTKQNFESEDIDIFVPVRHVNNEHKVENIEIFEEAKMLKRLYGTDFIIRFSKDNLRRDENGNILSLVTDRPENEKFDEYIIGTINTTYNGKKLQFIILNVYSHELEEWMKTKCDLPVFITVKENQIYFNESNELFAHEAKQGILQGLKHDYRKEKYTQKGFKCI